MDGEAHTAWTTKVILDIVCLLSVSTPIFVFFVSGQPYKRGFFCDDESLRHPYIDSTVPSWVLYVVGLGLPVFFIVLIEFFHHLRSQSRRHMRFMSVKLPNWMWESYKHIGIFGFGAACSQLLTDVEKYTIGRLRPHFFDVCRPNINCSDPKYQNVYIESYLCQDNSDRILKDMRLSFPSGHSSFSAYCMTFLAMYLQSKMTWRASKLLKHVIQFFCIMLSVYTALSRISDYKHHWSDVLVGFIQGVVVAILIVVFVSDLFNKPPAVSESPRTDGMRMENNVDQAH